MERVYLNFQEVCQQFLEVASKSASLRVCAFYLDSRDNRYRKRTAKAGSFDDLLNVVERRFGLGRDPAGSEFTVVIRPFLTGDKQRVTRDHAVAEWKVEVLVPGQVNCFVFLGEAGGSGQSENQHHNDSDGELKNASHSNFIF
jgi:hypothetical protein